jgi:hypothetical protein
MMKHLLLTTAALLLLTSGASAQAYMDWYLDCGDIKIHVPFSNGGDPGSVEIMYGDGSSPNIQTFAGSLVFGIETWYSPDKMGRIQVEDYGVAARKQGNFYIETIYQNKRVVDRKMNCVFNNPN